MASKDKWRQMTNDKRQTTNDKWQTKNDVKRITKSRTFSRTSRMSLERALTFFRPITIKLSWLSAIVLGVMLKMFHLKWVPKLSGTNYWIIFLMSRVFEINWELAPKKFCCFIWTRSCRRCCDVGLSIYSKSLKPFRFVMNKRIIKKLIKNGLF